MVTRLARGGKLQQSTIGVHQSAISRMNITIPLLITPGSVSPFEIRVDAFFPAL
jgi:hypothetical protein